MASRDPYPITTEATDVKAWYASKTIWFGVLIVVVAVAKIFGFDPDATPDWLNLLIAGLGTIGLRVNTSKPLTS